MYEEFYLNTRSVPRVFLEADRIMEKKYPIPDRIKNPPPVPMPYIDSNPNVEGPIYVTKDWFYKRSRKMMITKGKDRRDAHIEIMELLAQRDRIRARLGELDPKSKKDSRKIVLMNIDLKDIEADIEMWSTQFGIDVKELDKGTRFGRFIGRIKRKAKKVVNKVKKYIDENRGFLANMLAIVLPVVGSLICKFVFHV